MRRAKVVKKIQIAVLFAVVLCLVLSGQRITEEDELGARIQRVESRLVPGPGIVIKDHPIPETTITDRMEAYRVPGVSIAVINNHRIEWAKGYGVKGREENEPVTPVTLFQAASISKPVAATAALHYVEKGLLDLHEDVNQKLKSWKVPENEFTQDKKVTLRGILSHTAGLTVHGFPGYRFDKHVPSLVQILDGEKPANTAAIRVDITPGSKWRYSGGGYTVLQQLMIDVIGKPFPQILKNAVLDPFGMDHSTYLQPLPAGRASEAAIAHLRNGRAIKGNWHTYPEMAAAGLWTTPSDLCRFALEITASYLGNADKVISPRLAREMLTVVDGGNGLGLSARQTPALRFGHGGSNQGYQCTLVVWPEKGQGAAIMTNGDYGSNLMQEILSSLSHEYDWPSFQLIEKKTITLPRDELNAYAGEYRTGRAGQLNIVIEEGHVFVDKYFVIPEGKKRMEIFPWKKDKFFATESSVIFTFQRDAAGEINGLAYNEYGRKREATRIRSTEEQHKLSGVIKGFHLESYYAGTAFMAAEVVSYDIKKIALSPPYSKEELEVMLEVTQMAADEYDLPIYVEKDFLTTLLFDENLTKGKSVIFIARNQKVLEEYFALKELKQEAIEDGRLEKVQKELAWSFGRLLSYSDSAIRRLLSK